MLNHTQQASRQLTVVGKTHMLTSKMYIFLWYSSASLSTRHCNSKQNAQKLKTLSGETMWRRRIPGTRCDVSHNVDAKSPVVVACVVTAWPQSSSFNISSRVCSTISSPGNIHKGKKYTSRSHDGKKGRKEGS